MALAGLTTPNRGNGNVMRLHGPACGGDFRTTDIDVQGDKAHCWKCDRNFRLSLLMNSKLDDGSGTDPGPFTGGSGETAGVAEVASVPAADSPLDDPTQNPPAGCSYRQTLNGWVAGANTRSWFALWVIPFAAVWSGMSLGMIYGQQIVHHKLNVVMSLFGLPFLMGSVFIWGLAVMMVAGKVRVTCQGDQLEVFTGVLGLGIRKRVPIAGVRTVYAAPSYARRGAVDYIYVEGARDFRFGSGVNFTRQQFLLKVMRYKLGLRPPPTDFQAGEA